MWPNIRRKGVSLLCLAGIVYVVCGFNRMHPVTAQRSLRSDTTDASVTILARDDLGTNEATDVTLLVDAAVPVEDSPSVSFLSTVHVSDEMVIAESGMSEVNMPVNNCTEMTSVNEELVPPSFNQFTNMNPAMPSRGQSSPGRPDASKCKFNTTSLSEVASDDKKDPTENVVQTSNDTRFTTHSSSDRQNSRNSAGYIQPESIDVTLGNVTFTVCRHTKLCRWHNCPLDIATNVSHDKRTNLQYESLGLTADRENINSSRETTLACYTILEEHVSQHWKDKNNSKEGKRGNTNGAGSGRLKRQVHETYDSLSSASLLGSVCSCDEDCVLFGDCCLDVFDSCFGLEEPKDVQEFIIKKNTEFQLNQHLTNLTRDLQIFPENVKTIIRNILLQFSSCERNGRNMPMTLVSRCPREPHGGVLEVEECENPSKGLLPPVTAMLASESLTFKNVFCALCHGVSVTSLQVWLSEFSCTQDVMSSGGKSLKTSELEYLIKTGMCEVTFIQPGGTKTPRSCSTGAYQSAKVINALLRKQVDSGICTEENALLCQVYNFPRYCYNNPHCDMCFAPTISPYSRHMNINTCNPDMHASGSTDPVPIYVVETARGGILIVLDLTGTYTQSNLFTSYACDDTQVFDALMQECKTLMCSPGSEPYRGRCLQHSHTVVIADSSQVFPQGWDKVYLFIATRNFNFCDNLLAYFKDSSLAVENIAVDRVLDQVYLQSKDSSCFNSVKYHNLSTIINNQLQPGVELTLSLKGNASLDILEDLTKLPGYLIGHRFEISQVVTTNLIKLTRAWSTNQEPVSGSREQNSCQNGGNPAPKANVQLTDYQGNIYAMFGISQQQIYYPLHSIGFYLVADNSSDPQIPEMSNMTVFICEHSHLMSRTSCNIVAYNLNDTILNGSHILVLTTGRSYSEEDFQMTGDLVLVCSNFQFEVRTELIQQSLPYLVINWLFSIISIIFLLLMLVLYWWLPELRTLPGKMTASLAGTMILTFLSNLFTLVELHHVYVCPCVAALSHLVTLAHFGWMSAIAVNMALTFGPLANTLVKSVNDNTLFLRYNLAVWGLSLVVVMTSVVLDITHRDPQKNSQKATSLSMTSQYPRYGYPYCTWFSGPLWTKLAFIIVPYFITFIISLVGFILTLIGIQQASKMSEKLGRKQSEKQRCFMYIKLSSAMGFSWFTSALLNIYPTSPVLPYVYLCLVLLQGVLLFLAFMVNQRVASLLLRKFSFRRHKFSSSSTKSSIATKSV